MDVIQRKTCPVPASRCKSRGNCKGEIFSLENLTFKDPDFYIAGNLHKHILEWESLGASEEVLNWLKWIRDLPFVLDTLKDVTSILPPDSCMTTVDDKSGYDHILLSENSKKYFGIQFAGWYFVYNTLPFGFKASAYVYQTTGLVATGLVYLAYNILMID